MKKEYDIKKKTINIKIPVKEDKKFIDFTLENSLYRNKVRNAFVEEANKYAGDNNMYDEFNSLHYHTKYYNEVEKPNNIYYTKCIGISEQVSQDIKRAIKTIRTKNKKVFKGESHANLGRLHFKRFDPNKYSFKINLKPTLYTTKDGTIKSTNKLKILSNNEIIFKVRNKVPKELRESLSITLKESLYDDIDGNTYIRYYNNNGYINECRFTRNDIKEISFMYELGNYYIQLSIDVEYYISYINNKRKAGIDTGIHNPAILFDGNTSYIIRYTQKMSNKLHYLERRMKRLQHVLDNKVKGSNNYNKVLYKIRKIYKKIFNIKRDWRYKTCKDIVTRYNEICVDTFEQPENKAIELSNKLKHIMNYTNRFHCMYLFNETLRYMADKYGCKYVESPKDTTRTCSVCGHVNEHLLLSERYLICKKCGIKIDRDINAAQNCYAFIA